MGATGDRTNPTARTRSRAGSSGFTLLETALATVIIAIGVLALIEAQAVFSRNNDWSTSAATGTYLANEVRERLRVMPRHDPVTGLYFRTVNGADELVGWGPETGELTVTDYNDLDDFDGRSFGSGSQAPGPIDSSGRVINEIGPDGLPVIDDGQAIPLRGWVQEITVEKVDPQNFNTVRADNYVRAPVGQLPGLDVDRFPLRVTVVVRYTAPGEIVAREMAKVVWIAP